MDADELYGLPLDEFVAQRAAVAKALRSEGRRDEAAHVAKLRKPSVAGWAVNQLVRTQGRGVKELLRAGDALRDAQEDLLAGRSDGRALRSANERERSAVEGLVQTARGLLTSDGHELSAAIVERVSDTLHAAALDEDAREQIREGRLERELRHVGMGLGEGTSAPARGPKTTAPMKAPAATQPATAARGKASPRDPGARERARAEREGAKRVEAERAAARKAARVAEARARRRTERAASALRAAEERRERASEALDAAEEALVAARAEAQAAAGAHERAQAELERA